MNCGILKLLFENEFEVYLFSLTCSVVAAHLRGHGAYRFFVAIWLRRCAATTTLLNRYFEMNHLIFRAE